MWKCTSKVLITALRKSLQKTSTVFTTKVIQHKNLDYSLLCKPAVLEYFNRYYGFYTKSCGNFSKRKKQEGTNEKKTSFLEGFEKDVFDTLTLAAVSALAYFFVTRNKFLYFGSYDRQSTSTLSNYHKTLQFLAGSVDLKAFNYVLPEVQAAKTKRIYLNAQCFEKSEEENENFSSLEKAHKKVVGTLSNWMGTQYMESGDYKEALKFFSKAMNEKNPAGTFNLGICYEKGLGTSQNFEKAAELYQTAANLGHATAMYNLGVFYVQGLGGIQIDEDHARKLFTEAAKLGQKKAIEALSLEQESLGDIAIENIKVPQQMGNSPTQSISDKFFNFKPKRIIKNCESSMKNTNEFLDLLEQKSVDSSINSDSGVLDLSSPNHTEVLPL